MRHFRIGWGSFGLAAVVLVAVLAMALAALLVGGCGARMPAPVEDRSGLPRTEPAARQVPAPENYRVQRGDSLYSIAFRYGLDWRTVADWNRIGQPYTIHPGQTIRLRPPAAGEAVVVRPPPERQPETRVPRPSEPVTRPEPRPAPVPETVPESRPQPAEPRPAPGPVTAGPTRSAAGIAWQWPTEGRLTRRFDAGDTRRGIHITGSAGQPVLAAADGQVVYSGTGLIGYGELIIIKHSDSMLSAYGHNRQRLVAEGDRVRAGQQIAEMGLNERNQEILHFEIRRNGQPEDPMNFLPRR